jgi:tRNA(Arg) A34 adenosine deaminase TadA
MCSCSRRTAIAILAVAVLGGPALAAPDERTKKFIEAAFKMKAEAERTGDQPYGAVVVKGDEIVGFGPSRVVIKRDWTAHAEREAMRDAQRRLARADLSDCVMYSTSRPCSNCERAAAEARLGRMFYGPNATDAGPPRSS